MTPNTKVGLLIGLAFIIGIGMLLSQQVQPAANRDMVQLVPDKPSERAAMSSAPGGERVTLTGRRSDPAAGPSGLTSVDAPAFRPSSPSGLAGAPTPPSDLLAGGLAVDGGRDLRSAITDPLHPTGPGALPAVVVTPSMGPAPLPVGWKLHKVQAGETLSAISTKYYQTCKNYELIYNCNKDKMSSPNVIHEGMEIRIPPAEPVAGTALPASPAAPAASDLPPALTPPGRAPVRRLDSPLLERVPAGGRPAPLARPSTGAVAAATYRVKEGDTLNSIAASVMGGRGQWRAIYEANKDVISDPNRLKIGLMLRVPEARLALQN